MCPKCGGYEFEIVTIESVLQHIAMDDDSRADWAERVTLAVLNIIELRCMTCGVDFSRDERMKQLIVERCA